MPEIGEDTDYADRLGTNAEALKGAWNATREELHAMEAELAEEGWDVLAVSADHVAPEAPDFEPKGRFGLTYTFVDNVAEEVRAHVAETAGLGVEEFDGLDDEETLELGAFDRFEVYQRETDGHVYQVVAYFDDEAGAALLLAGAYELMYANSLRETVVENDVMYTHLQQLGGSPIASFRHDEWEPFFPNARQRLTESPDDE